MKDIQKKSKKVLQVEEQLNESIEEVLRRLYVDKNMTVENISKQINISYVSILKLLDMAGIYSRRLNLED